MATINSITANPASVSSGETSVITVSVTPTPATPDKTATLTVTVDGETGTGTVTLAGAPAETLTYSTDPADQGKPGYVVITCDVGTLTLNPDNTLTYTAP